jgi:hypothetical protein
MTNTSPDELYRNALQAEDGEAISAGARVSHVQAAAQAGRAVYVDLSAVPEEKRPALIAEINELVRRVTKSPSPQTPVPGVAPHPAG